MEKYGITLKESRGRFSYLHPERQKYITGRKLGSHFEKDYILALFAENARTETKAELQMSRESSATARDSSKTASSPLLTEYDPGYDYQSDPVAILFVRSDLHLVVDLQANIKAQQSAAYARKVKISNLKEMARTVCYIQENGYDTRENLAARLDEVTVKLSDARKTLRATQDRIRLLNEQIHYVGQYQTHKSVQRQFPQSRNKKKFRQDHQAELTLYDAGVSYIKEHFSGKVPSLKTLKAERDQLLQMKDAQTDTYKYFKEFQKELRTASSNVDAILGIDHSRTKGIEKAQDIS